MAGYIMTLKTVESLENYASNGVYSTIISLPRGHWLGHHEGTFADFATMKQGDNIYFFKERKIYGIGELININGDCKFLNYPNANIPQKFDYKDLEDDFLWDEGEISANQRWMCVFKPSPFFFKKGIDMDEALSSYPSKFRNLRAFWKLSFIKIDEEENQALKDVILKNNQDSLLNNNDVFLSEYGKYHQEVEKKTPKTDDKYKFQLNQLLSSSADGSKLKHEMALEASLLFQLSNNHRDTVDIFGSWDYLSHQVIASPFKPIDYMDKMDIFGYSFIEGYTPTISKYLVIELKKDSSNVEDVDQLLKYVDWVNDEYAHGDYLMINSFLVASDFNDDVINYAKENGIRKYTIGRRPAKSGEWANIKLVKYSYNKDSNLVDFEVIY
jgi:hypothetical protein